MSSSNLSFRKEVLKKLESPEFLERLYTELRRIYQDKIDFKSIDQDELLELIERHRLLEKFGGTKVLYEQSISPSLKEPKTGVFMSLRIVSMKSGKLSGLQRFDSFKICVSFGEDRVETRELPKAETDLVFDELFSFELVEGSEKVSLNSIAESEKKLEMFIVGVSSSGSERGVLLGMKRFEWRNILTHGKIDLSLGFEAAPEFVEADPAWKVKVSLELQPKSLRKNLLHENVIDLLAKNKSKQNEEATKGYFEYSQALWKELTSKVPNIENFNVRLFMQDEFAVYRPISLFLCPLYLRQISSPSLALRFVSLFEYEGAKLIKKDFLPSFTFGLLDGVKSRKFAAFFLCSCLLGFNLDAYVVCGLSSEGEHFWVLTLSQNGSKIEGHFWEPTKGMKVPLGDPKVHYLYRKIGMLISPATLHINLNSESVAAKTSFDFSKKTEWRSINMAPFELTSIQYLQSLKEPLDLSSSEAAIEKKLKKKLSETRRGLGLETKISLPLGHLLSIACENFEKERSGNFSNAKKELDECVKNFGDGGFEFQAIPVQINNMGYSQVENAVFENQLIRALVKSERKNLAFGLKTKAYAYPEGVLSLWVIFAAQYSS